MLLRLLFVALCVQLVPGYDYHGPWSEGYHHHYHQQRRIPRDVMVDVINDLGLYLLEIHNDHNDNNIAISPYGATSVLVALYEGLVGDAAYEIKHAIHLPPELSTIRVGLRDIHRHLKSYFIPKEGFLAGLTLSHDNITLSREYESILKFYGYDVDSFNNPTYPNGSTTDKNSTPTSTTPATTIITTESPNASTDSMKPERTTRIEEESVRTTQLPPVEDEETTGTTKRLPTRSYTTTDSNEITTNEVNTRIADTTKLEENTVGPSEGTTVVEIQRRNDGDIGTMMDDDTTINDDLQTTTVVATNTQTSPNENKITNSDKPIENDSKTTVPNKIDTTLDSSDENKGTTLAPSDRDSTLGLNDDNKATTMAPNNKDTTLASIDIDTTIASNDKDTTLASRDIDTSIASNDKDTTLASKDIDTTIASNDKDTTVMKNTETVQNNLETSPPPNRLLTTVLNVNDNPSQEATTVSSITNSKDVEETTISNNGITSRSDSAVSASGESNSQSNSARDTTISNNGNTLRSDPTIEPNGEATTNAATVSSNNGATVINEETTINNEVQATTVVNSDTPTGGITEAIAPEESESRSGELAINANLTTPSRKKRSVIDYLIARYYDNYFINSRHGYLPRPHYAPYQPEVPYTFLIDGKYREPNISFMTYDTVLPFYYIPELDAMALSFPLDSSMYYLLLVLPVDEHGIDKLIYDFKKVTSLKAIVEKLKYTHVKAVIPSFMLKGYVVLTPTLQKLCIRKIFEPRQADFSQLTTENGIYVTNIEQAVTVTIRNYLDPNNASGRNLRAYRPVEFRADHPFLYFVMDANIHVNLMAGKIINPLNSRIR